MTAPFEASATPPDLPSASGPEAADASLRRRAELGPGGLRGRVARGSIVNTGYFATLNALTIVQGLIVARLLGVALYGRWGLITICFGTLFALAAIGVDDKYIQQDHPDQRVAFEIAFTLQTILCGVFTLIGLVAIPLFSVIYGQPGILVPGLVLCAGLPLIPLQTPMWVFYRRMRFGRARFLEGLNPIVSLLVTVPLLLTGVGFWSLVIGTLAGAVASTVAALAMSPYKLRFRYERGAAREYTSYSWPLLANSASALVTGQLPIVLASRVIGLAAVGAITLTSQITAYAYRVDNIVTHALYPAICAVKDQRELLFESFSKSNRLAILWGFPVGVGAALFATPAVHFVLGDRWRLAVPLIAVVGISTALNQIGFNWTALVRARAETRILAVEAGVLSVLVLGVGVPLLLTHGLIGYGIGLLAGTLGSLTIRLGYLVRLFPGLRIFGHVAAAITPSLIACAVVLLVRKFVAANSESWSAALFEALLYVAIVGGLSWQLEKRLLGEMVSYLKGAVTAAAPQ